LLKTIDLVKANLNPELEIQGIVLTMYDKRNKLSEQVEADVRENMGDKVYRTEHTPQRAHFRSAPSHGLPALVYDLRMPGQHRLTSGWRASWYSARSVTGKRHKHGT
jgi:chromosome partitioning protein